MEAKVLLTRHTFYFYEVWTVSEEQGSLLPVPIARPHLCLGFGPSEWKTKGEFKIKPKLIVNAGTY